MNKKTSQNDHGRRGFVGPHQEWSTDGTWQPGGTEEGDVGRHSWLWVGSCLVGDNPYSRFHFSVAFGVHSSSYGWQLICLGLVCLLHGSAHKNLNGSSYYSPHFTAEEMGFKEVRKLPQFVRLRDKKPGTELRPSKYVCFVQNMPVFNRQERSK